MPLPMPIRAVLRFLTGVEVVNGAGGVVFTVTSDGRPTGADGLCGLGCRGCDTLSGG